MNFFVSGDGRIIDADKASIVFGSGGNYKERRTNLRGKIQGNGKVVKIRGKKNKYLHFSTKKGSVVGNDRTELAHGPAISFDDDVLISFDLRIPKSAPINRGYMYLLQSWQFPKPGQRPTNPMAGIKIRSGTSHGIDVITRTETRGAPTIGKADLKPGKWHHFDITIRPGFDDPVFKVIIDGATIAKYTEDFGRSDMAFSHRIKFGLYGLSQGPAFKSHFDNFSLVVN